MYKGLQILDPHTTFPPPVPTFSSSFFSCPIPASSVKSEPVEKKEAPSGPAGSPLCLHLASQPLNSPLKPRT